MAVGKPGGWEVGMAAMRPRGLAALGLVALLVLLAACTREPAAPPQPPLTLSSGPSTLAAPAAGDGDWTTYHRDNARSGYLAGLADPTRLAQAWSARLDGAVYGEPLVVGDRVLVATEADSLYSLELRSGRVQWRTTVGEPVPLSELPCGNIDPLGITGTPVYDPGTGLVFAVAEVSGPVGHRDRRGVDQTPGSVDLAEEVRLAVRLASWRPERDRPPAPTRRSQSASTIQPGWSWYHSRWASGSV